MESDHSSGEDAGERRRRLAGWAGLVLAVGLLAFVASRTEIAEVAGALSRGGLALLALALFYPLRLTAHAEAWRLVYPAAGRPGRRVLLAGMWMAHSVNFLLPTATIGGDIVRGRIGILRGAPEVETVTSLVADKTAHAFSTVALLGLGLPLAAAQGAGRGLLTAVGGTTIVLGAGVLVFVRIQRSSGLSGLLERWAGEGAILRRATVGARQVEEQLDALYARRREFALATASRVAGTVAMAAELWAASRLLGTPISVADAVTLKVLGVGIRSAAFFVWGGLGLQEGTFALLAPLTDLSPSALVALSLATRVRELAVALPGVGAWLAGEGLRAARGGE